MIGSSSSRPSFSIQRRMNADRIERVSLSTALTVFPETDLGRTVVGELEASWNSFQSMQRVTLAHSIEDVSSQLRALLDMVDGLRASIQGYALGASLR